jgi:hypothetical protein
MLTVTFAVGAGMALWIGGAGPTNGQPSPEQAAGFAAVPGAIGSQDLTGLPQVGPSISFPVAGLWRDATRASLPGVGGTDQDTRKWLTMGRPVEPVWQSGT